MCLILNSQGVSWSSLSIIYTSLPFFTVDFDVFSIREPVALEIENTGDPLLGSSSLQDETSKENFGTNKMERNVSKFEELTKKNRSTLYCSSTAALVVAEGKSFQNLWKNEDLFFKFFIFIPFNPKNCRWILVVVNISERATGVLDPLATDTHWTDASVQRGQSV